MVGVSIRDLTRDFPGMDDASVNALIKLGILSTLEEFNPKSRRTMRTLTRDSVDRFRTTYVLLKELCSVSSLGHLAVRKRLQEAGVDLAFPRNGMRAFVYPRVAALEAIRTEPA